MISDSGQHQGAATSQGEATQEPASAPDLIPALRNIEAAIRDLVPEKDKAKDRRQEEREIADLIAQSDMALWAERMFWATLGTVFLTAAGVILIWRTLHHTKRAADAAYDAVVEARKVTAEAVKQTALSDKSVEEARRAANISQQQLTNAQDVSHKEIRAYLSISPVGVQWDAPNNRLHVHIMHSNSGSTPALNVKSAVDIEFRPYPLPDNHQIEGLKFDVGTTVIHPGVKSAINPAYDGFDKKAAHGIQFRKDRVTVRAILKYDTIFESDRETSACWSFNLTTTALNQSVGGVKEIPVNYSETYNTAT